MLQSRSGLAAIVLDNVPPATTDVAHLMHTEDVVFADASDLLSFVSAATGKDTLEAAEAVASAVSDFPDGEDAILELALTDPPPPGNGKLELAAFIAAIRKDRAR